MRSLLVVGLLACGGGEEGDGRTSGLPPGARVAELDAIDIDTLCAYLVDAAGPDRRISCSDGDVTVSIESFEECVERITTNQTDFPSCPVTVSQAESCAEETGAQTDEQLCAGLGFPASCSVLSDPACF